MGRVRTSFELSGFICAVSQPDKDNTASAAATIQPRLRPPEIPPALLFPVEIMNGLSSSWRAPTRPRTTWTSLSIGSGENLPRGTAGSASINLGFSSGTSMVIKLFPIISGVAG